MRLAASSAPIARPTAARPGLRLPARRALRSPTAAASAGDYPQNWYDQGIAVDPNNPDRVFFDTFEVWFWQNGNAVWNDITCGYGT